MKKYFAYYNQYKNGIDIAFDDNVLLFISCSEAEKDLHTTPNSQRLIDNLAIDEPLKYWCCIIKVDSLFSRIWYIIIINTRTGETTYGTEPKILWQRI